MSKSSNDRVGQKISNYNLVRLIGHGGFADVYLGEHIYLKTLAAIKVLHIRATDTDQSDILNEARAIAQLEHPNIVRMLEYGIEDGYPFLIMSYASQGSLRHYYPKGTQLSVERVIAYAQQVAAALDYAHKNKLIHRDVKPENILMGQDNQVLLTDFGLVMMAQASHSQSSENLAGTVAYMAPEQLRGRPRFASDQYALGIVVYEWLCGKRPFTGSFPEVASQHMLEPPPSMRALNSTVTPEVEQIVFKALAKEPSSRFESAGEFVYVLSRTYNHLKRSQIYLGSLPTTQELSDQSSQPQASTTRNTSAQPQVTPLFPELDSNTRIETSLRKSITAANLQVIKPPSTIIGERISKRTPSIVTSDVPRQRLSMFPTFRLSLAPLPVSSSKVKSRPALMAPVQPKKNLKGTFILVILLLMLGSGITLGLNRLMNVQTVSVSASQSHNPASTTTAKKAGGAVNTARSTTVDNMLTKSTPTINVVPTAHTFVPVVAPTTAARTNAPKTQSIGSTPAKPNVDPTTDPNVAPTTNPTAAPTVDPTTNPTAAPTTNPNTNTNTSSNTNSNTTTATATPTATNNCLLVLCLLKH